MRYWTANWTAACLVMLGAIGAAAADDEIRLSGCLVRGQDGQGYLVTNVPGEAAWQQPADATVVPGPVGTSGTISSILYWLEKRDVLDNHVGHYVEIEGKLQGDLQEGQIKVTPKAEWTDVEVKADGKSMKAQVPRSVLIIPDKDKGDRELDVLVRRVEPQRVRMLAAVCGR
jgi:hypothetical protein